MRTAVSTLLASVVVLAHGAPARADVQQWSEVGVEREVSPDLALSFDTQLRFDEDISRLAAILPEVGVQHRARRWLRLGVGYRLQHERSGSGDFRTRHRFFAAVRARVDIGEVRLEGRLQLQEQLRPDDGNSWAHVVRSRLDAAYRDLRPWVPEASVELFTPLADGDAVGLDKVRLTAGLGHGGKRRDLAVFYRIELPIADDTEPTLHILGLSAHFEL